MYEISKDVLEEAKKYIEEKKNIECSKSFVKTYYKSRVRAYTQTHKEYMEEKKEYFKAYREQYKQETKGFCKTCNKEYMNIDLHFVRSIHKKRLLES